MLEEMQSFWYWNEPNGSGLCGVIYSGYFADRDCSHQSMFICKKGKLFKINKKECQNKYEDNCYMLDNDNSARPDYLSSFRFGILRD